MSGFTGKVAVVTGAGSGIGRALTLDLARRGARLAISDVDEANLAETANAAEAFGAAVHHRRLDVSDRDAWGPYADAVVARYGVVHQVYNNAGIAHSRTVLESELGEYERVLGVNLWGVLYGTKAFLQHVVDSGDGHVVNVSSLNGLMAQARMSHYCTSKFGVRGFTESLRLEMEAGGHPVKVTSVHPGGIKTNIATSAMAAAEAAGLPITQAERRRQEVYNDKLLKMPPEQAARIILDGVEAGNPRVLVGTDAKAVDLLLRVVPSGYARLVRVAEKRFG